MYLSEDTALVFERLPLEERYAICRRACKLTDDPEVHARLLALAIEPRIPDGEYEHLMSCRDPHCQRCEPVAA